MSTELDETILALGTTVEQFMAEVKTQIVEMKAGKDDPVLAEKIDKMNASISEISALKRQIEAIETAIARRNSGGDPTAVNQVQAEHKKVFDAWFRKGGEARLEAVKDLQVKAGLSTLSDPDGGYAIAPPEFDQAIDRVAGTISVFRKLATVRTIGTDTYTKLVNQGGTSSGWVAEKSVRTETDTSTLAEITINTKELYAMPGTTQKALDDLKFDVPSWLADEVTIEFAEQEGDAWINGNGVGEPKGIDVYTKVANASYAWGKVGFITSGHATLFNDLTKLVDLQHALLPIYRNGASWLMNDATCATLRKIQNGEGEFIWRPGLTEGAPDTLLGKPVAYDDNVASVGANTYPIWFGNFKRAYLIIDRIGIRILRDPYTSKGNVLFYTTKRTGGGIIMYGAIKCMKIAA